MKKNVRVFKVHIIEFINTKDKNKKYDNFQEFIKDGGVTEYCFKYRLDEDRKDIVRTSQRIRKLDLYNKEVYTINDNIKYKILNEI